MNSFALLIGHCVIIPPSAKAALIILMLTFGIGDRSDGFVKSSEMAIASQYMAAGETEKAAMEKIAWLNRCYLSYEPERK